MNEVQSRERVKDWEESTCLGNPTSKPCSNLQRQHYHLHFTEDETSIQKSKSFTKHLTILKRVFFIRVVLLQDLLGHVCTCDGR